MIDLTLLRNDAETVRRSQAARGKSPATVDEALSADQARRDALRTFEELRAEQNGFGKQVAQASGDEKTALLAKLGDLSDRVKAAQHAATAASDAADAAMAQIDNVIIDGVPARTLISRLATTSNSANFSVRLTWSAARRFLERGFTS
jgi:seryl-tRNA synthetase